MHLFSIIQLYIATPPPHAPAYHVIVTEDDAYNARLQPLGYRLELRNGSRFVKALHGYPFDKVFETEKELDEFVAELEDSDQWCLDLDKAGADVDRETGKITPHDGSAPFSVEVATMWGGGRALRRRTDKANAEYIQITSVERPEYGGNWYKVRPPIGDVDDLDLDDL